MKITSGKKGILSWFIEWLRATFKDSKKVFTSEEQKLPLELCATGQVYASAISILGFLAPYDAMQVV